MNRVVVSVATGPRFVAGLRRLRESLQRAGECIVSWEDSWPEGAPAHADSPYEFKLHAMEWARLQGFDQVLWCDSSIIALRPLEPLWNLVANRGYWISRNFDYVNGRFTADSAYQALGISRVKNWEIPHVVATAWAVDFSHAAGRQLFDAMTGFARKGAFRGPWLGGSADPRVVGHRHDQTALSVAAWELGLTLTEMPSPYAEDSGDSAGTILVARRG